MTRKIIFTITILTVVLLLGYFGYELLSQNVSVNAKKIALANSVPAEGGGNKFVVDTYSSSKNSPADFTPDKKNLLPHDNQKTQIQEDKPQSANYGLSEGVNPQLNLQVASVAEALKNTKFPERLSPLIQPKPFDRVAFEKDPQVYLNTIEPGRVFQSKNPAAGEVVLQRISEAFVTIEQNKSTVLKVKALPNMPVSFTSFDLGSFQNKLTAITVQADKDGLAQTTFIATVGTIADCNILVSCPETSGRVKFVITITKNNLFSQEK
jgi:hypothetical protein